ncbi:hypothetical protein BVG80_04005 [Sphingobacteriales bacterium TSM_CSM]|nr:hypothetical protein BVG80_04005 [Sphingobacteriales bacterium TSM_CSM]
MRRFCSGGAAAQQPFTPSYNPAIVLLLNCFISGRIWQNKTTGYSGSCPLGAGNRWQPCT